MQQLKVEHKNTKEKDRRSGKGRVLALSRRVYRIQNSDTFYVESETSDNNYYYVKFKPSIFEWCSCKDFESNRAKFCKHLFAVEFAIRLNTLKDTEKLPAEAKRYPSNNDPSRPLSQPSDTGNVSRLSTYIPKPELVQQSNNKSFERDEYSY
jgi:hypothetical protein